MLRFWLQTKELGRNRLSLQEINDVKGQVVEWAKGSGIYAGAAEQVGQTGDTNYEFTGDPTLLQTSKAIEGANDTGRAHGPLHLQQH